MAQLKLLVVDDDARSRDVWGLSLRKAGYDVITMRDAEAALDALSPGRVDVVVSEIYLPGMDGYALCQKIRQAPQFDHIAFAFLTYSDALEDRTRGFEAGCDDYLVKPLFFREMVDRIETLSRRRRLAAQSGHEALVGTLAELGIIDLIQLMEMQRKGGVIAISGPLNERGELRFNEGSLINAKTTSRTGEAAVMRMFGWDKGSFRVAFSQLDESPSISHATGALIMDGLQHVHSCDQIKKRLPPLDTACAVDHERLASLTTKISADAHALVQAIDGQSTLDQIVATMAIDELRVLESIQTLVTADLLLDTNTGSPLRPGSPTSDTSLEDTATGADTSSPLSDDVDDVFAGLEASLGESTPQQDLHPTESLGADSLVVSGVAYSGPQDQPPAHLKLGSDVASVETLPPEEHVALPTQPTWTWARHHRATLLWVAMAACGWIAAAWVSYSASRRPRLPPASASIAREMSDRHAASHPPSVAPQEGARSRRHSTASTATATLKSPSATSLSVSGRGATSPPLRNEESLILRARLLAGAGKQQQADALLTRAAQRPNAWMATERLAMVILARGRDAEAKRLATHAAKINPRAPYAQFVLGCVAQQSGRRRAARTAYKRFLALCPDCRFADEVRSVLGYL